MKIIYFIVINVLAVLAMVGANMYAFINNIEHTNSIYFWIMAYACVIGCSIIGINCRNQSLRLEEVIDLKLKLEPTDEEIQALLVGEQEDIPEVEESIEEEGEPLKKRSIFKKRA